LSFGILGRAGGGKTWFPNPLRAKKIEAVNNPLQNDTNVKIALGCLLSRLRW
jgi:hypothetical protein